ncbi:MAG: alpha-galactosidase [Actinobacteria bacterium]|nr:alpha-galactosidase [Actinomycetota bacterium]
MELHLDRVEVWVGGNDAAAATRHWTAVRGTGAHQVGPVEVSIGGGPDRWTWSVAGRSDQPVRLRGVRLVMRVTGGRGPLRLLRNGYQSWSPSGVATLGVDRDPSNGPRVPRLVRATHHADEEVADPGELRSECVTILADDGPQRVLVGFEGGASHDGTLRLAATDHGPELAAEAYLGGARLDPGTTRSLHPLLLLHGEDHAALLDGWAAAVGRAERARAASPYQVGWCSWYHYFGAVTEADIRANLARAAEWPFEVFQVDDGFQPTIGDWRANERFPSGLERLAAAIDREGLRPGVWLAPFLARPDAQVVADHPGWVARYRDGERPLVGMWHPVWGGDTWVLDTTNPEVLDHLERLAADLVGAGFTYLKLDFTYAPSVDGIYVDPTRTPAERVRAGYDAVRRGAGDDTFLLGCGAPLGAVVGVVDGMRIGPDVAPSWPVDAAAAARGDYAAGEPATANAHRETLVRSALHRRLWLNDPDCLMLRRTATGLSRDALEGWAWTVAASGGMALVSDDLSLLDGDARRLLDAVVALGRAADAEAVSGSAPRCTDLLEACPPTTLEAAGRCVQVDPVTGRAESASAAR